MINVLKKMTVIRNNNKVPLVCIAFRLYLGLVLGKKCSEERTYKLS